MASFLSPLLEGDARYVLQNSRNQRVLATRLEPAFDSASRKRGLLGRETLDEGAALILAPCNSIHTFFMRMAIDVVFVARDGLVLKTRSALPPWRMALAFGGFAVVELPPGAVAAADVRRGDRLKLRHLCRGSTL